MLRGRTLRVIVTLDPRVESLRETLPTVPARIHAHVLGGTPLPIHDAWLDEEVSLIVPPEGARLYARLGELKTPTYRFEPDPTADPDDEELFWTDTNELELMRWATVCVRVCTPAGAPIAGVAIRIDGESGMTDAVGVLELAGAIGNCAFGLQLPTGFKIRSGPDRVVTVSEREFNDVIVCLEPE